MYVKIVLGSLLALVLQHFIRLLYMMGYHITVYNHAPGPCRFIPGIDHGSEDMETLPNGITFISSGLLMPSASENSRKYYQDHNVQGRIFLFDFNSPEKGVKELKLSNNFDKSAFRPHGLSIYQNPSTGKILLFVVNHAPGVDKIEKFEYIEKDQMLKHLQSYTNDAIRVANDVAATGEDSFYFTNYNYYYGSGLKHKLEGYMLMPYGSIVYYDGHQYTTVSSGFVLPNGVILSKDGQYVYMATSVYGLLYIFKRENNNSLTLLQEFPLHSKLDNILIEPKSNNLVIGGHPVTYRTMEHMNNPGVPAPSKVFLVNMRDSSQADNITELYSDDGHRLWGSTVASVHDNKMLIGTIAHKLLYCDVHTLT